MDLTILVVTRDRPILLEHSIRSILASARAAEPEVATRILVIDDSDDCSAMPIAGEFGVDYMQNPIRLPGNGLSVARAWALPQVDTELVALFDDDDIMLQDHIPGLVRHMRDGAEICSTGFWLADPDPTDVTKLVARPRPVRLRYPRLGDLLVGYQCVNDQAMLRTDVAQSVVWDPGWEIQMPYHVWIQLLFAGRRFVVNQTPTFLYRQHAASLSHNLGEREAQLRNQLIAESRALAVERFGRVPGPSLEVRLSLAKQAILREARRYRIAR